MIGLSNNIGKIKNPDDGIKDMKEFVQKKLFNENKEINIQNIDGVKDIDVYSFLDKENYTFNYLNLEKFLGLERNYYEEKFFNLRNTNKEIDNNFFRDLSVFIFVEIDNYSDITNKDFISKKMEIEESEYYGLKKVIYYTKDFLNEIKEKDFNDYVNEKISSITGIANASDNEKIFLDFISSLSFLPIDFSYLKNSLSGNKIFNDTNKDFFNNNFSYLEEKFSFSNEGDIIFNLGKIDSVESSLELNYSKLDDLEKSMLNFFSEEDNVNFKNNLIINEKN